MYDFILGNNMEKVFDIQVGDVMIVKGKTKTSKFLANAQKLLYWENTSSHVLISYSDGFYIHSTGDKGVHLISFKELLHQIEPNFKIIRFKNLDEEKIDNLRKFITFYMNQNYNKAFFLDIKNRSFCSQLVAKIYEKADIKIFNKRHSLVTPADFEKAANTQINCNDITKETISKYVEYIKMGKSYDIAYFSLLNIMNLTKMRIKMNNQLYEMINKSDFFNEDFRNFYNRMQKELAPKLNVLNWDDIHNKHYLNKKN